MKTKTATAIEMTMEMEMGKVYDVGKLFSTPQRDFLIRNNGEKVKVESLKGKIVAIYFLSLEDVESSVLLDYSYSYRFSLEYTRSIKVVYDDLSPLNNFEVVFVADTYDGDELEDKELFDKYFSGMPWLAIPQDDSEFRTKLFGMRESKFVCIILDAEGKIVNLDAITDFDDFGAEGYPFTPERKIEIDNDDMLARASMSVERLLTCDFLIRSNSEEVPVSELDRKVVAFYFYTRSGCESKTVDELIVLYKKLQEMGKQFEIVFINSRSRANEDEKSYMEAFKRTPWIGLPSNDRSYLKLMRIFRCSEGDLVIVSPGEKFPDTYGLEVIDRYGIDAYPFTRKRVTEMEVERLESLTLESILFSGRHKYIVGESGQKITAHHLKNKTILLLFTMRGCSYCLRLMPSLITWYKEAKKTAKEDFEIIHIPYDYSPAKKCYFGTMPWLQFPYDAKYNKNMFRKTFNLPEYRGTPAIIAFGADGKILNMNLECKFLSEEWESNIEYPFDFFSEVERKIALEMDGF